MLNQAAEKTSQALREKGHDKDRPQTTEAASDTKSPAFLLPAPSAGSVEPNPSPPSLEVPGPTQANVAPATETQHEASKAANSENAEAIEVEAVIPETTVAASVGGMQVSGEVPTDPVVAAPAEATEPVDAAVLASTIVAAPTDVVQPVDNAVPPPGTATIVAPTNVVAATTEALDTAVVAANNASSATTMQSSSETQDTKEKQETEEAEQVQTVTV